MYDPTDLEKTFAAQMFADKGLGGSAFAMLLGAGGDRQRDIAQYNQDLAASNQLQFQLAQQEMKNQLAETALKELAPLTNAGFPLETLVPAQGLSTTGFTDPQTRQSSAVVVALKEAQRQHALAQAAHAGDAGATKDTVATIVGPDGRVIGQTFTTSGKSGAVPVLGQNTQGVRTNMFGNYGVQPGKFVYQQPTAVQQRQFQLSVPLGEGQTYTFGR